MMAAKVNRFEELQYKTIIGNQSVANILLSGKRDSLYLGHLGTMEVVGDEQEVVECLNYLSRMICT